MDLKKSKIGVWGFGVVGKAAVSYLKNNAASLEVLVDATIDEQDKIILSNQAIPLRGSADLAHFLEHNNYILPSPGINLANHQNHAHKWLAELDLFASDYEKPIIAITGTVGKTSVTHLLSQLLSAYDKKVLTGGNIGIGMLDLLSQEPGDMALLEISSFQLDLCRTFAPDLAIWTTFSANHLDRHGTMDAYFAAKYAIIRAQKPHQKALLPFSIISYLELHDIPKSQLFFFINEQPSVEDLITIKPYGGLFFVRDHALIFTANGHETPLIDVATLPPITFSLNWIIIASALHLLDMPLNTLASHAQTVSIPEHRLEKVATIDDVTFYNDSKSTTPPSAQAAVANFGAHTIHLLLGGLSKGIDRIPLIENLGSNVAHVYCFGKESQNLHTACHAARKSSSAHATLEEAFAHCVDNAQPGSIVLLSPAGSSYDLFVDYKARGTRFKELVHDLINTRPS